MVYDLERQYVDQHNQLALLMLYDLERQYFLGNESTLHRQCKNNSSKNIHYMLDNHMV